MLAERVRMCLDKIININKTSGPKEIQNNILNIKTIIEYINIIGKNSAMVQKDQKKAFDRLEQNYLYKTLEKFGFGKNVLNWTKILYRNINSCVQVNVAKTDKFEIKRSVRQACPLSMLLYVRAMEIFSIKFNKNQEIKGIQVPNIKEEVKMLQLIQDRNYYNELIKEFNKFGKVLGSKTNPN